MKKWIPAALCPVLLLSFAIPAFAGQAGADQSIDVKGKYTGNFGAMHTLILGNEDRMSLGDGQTMSITLTNTADRGLRMVVTPVSRSEAESYGWLSGQTARTGTSPYACHIAFYDGDTMVSLDGEAVIRMNIPSGYGNAAFYYMDNEGNLSLVRTQKSGNRLSFTAKNAGYYLFLKPLSSAGSDSDEDSGNDSDGSSAGSGSGSSSSGVRGSASAGTVTSDSRKGVVHSADGILTGTTGSMAANGRSHWILDNRGWRLRYADGTYASGTTRDGTEACAWEKIDGSWYLFGADGYARFGWHLDTETGYWYYLDVNRGMVTGWHKDPQDGYWYYLQDDGVMAVGWRRIGGSWYFFNDHTPEATWEFHQTERLWKYRIDSSGRPYGSMYQGERTPDGYYVDADGVWNGKKAAGQPE